MWHSESQCHKIHWDEALSEKAKKWVCLGKKVTHGNVKANQDYPATSTVSWKESPRPITSEFEVEVSRVSIEKVSQGRGQSDVSDP